MQMQKANSSHKVIGITIVILTLGALTVPALISYQNNKTFDRQINLNSCLSNAAHSYEANWAEADKDGDGRVSYSDGATNITTTYYDANIQCYRTYRVKDSDEYIADYQTKRQQETDSYSTWLESLNSSKPTTNCYSTITGSTIQTTCI